MQRKPGGCPHCGDSHFEKVKFADSGNKKLRIDTPENIKESWKSLERERKAGHYTDAQVRRLEEKIINAWIQHVNLEGPPLRKIAYK